jgi:hypothetical protein
MIMKSSAYYKSALICFLWLVFSYDASADTLEQSLNGLVLPCESASDVPACKYALQTFRKDYPKALKKDYQAQRNVAFCLSTGCDGAVYKNPIQGCAWRMIILGSGKKQVDESDTGSYGIYCKRLDKDAFKAARIRADNLFYQIYGRPLPAEIY